MLVYGFMLFIFMYFIGLLVMCLKCSHLLLMLLTLEFIVLSLFFGLVIFILTFMYESYFLMIFLSLSVCEGALGLSILVSLVRMYGNDYFNSFSILW
uniref:NADH dehydrogenase subunit 4L n=1 Tax=Abscondita chinensis TaxID=2599921 RepID=UPI002238B9CF|nr:NADH dehydrogenase subunit 4L [Abscondita chinensis]UYG18645.1 NADH dehydrogenase subunit 4L [Abscondita chinensis]UYG49087.1 NADH dehydrogenase subunit 4L [Abscondita chinensis]UYG49100.1 NADH dehydrogenase subunit 4L [Abscondita chinensis]UYG49113.1 NADH dehydrogenase subunit 4L [Abscondita chinensis]UYG49126.1 NADH dehydrogenase subunit 4L [Abscondita chinensis]